MPNKYFTDKKPYRVFMEDHWDYYKTPPERPKLGEFDSYTDAVKFACSEIKVLLESLKTDPASIYILPEPPGLHFNSYDYEDYLNNLNPNNI
jgi:hypothetical protein